MQLFVSWKSLSVKFAASQKAILAVLFGARHLLSVSAWYCLSGLWTLGSEYACSSVKTLKERVKWERGRFVVHIPVHQMPPAALADGRGDNVGVFLALPHNREYDSMAEV